MDPRELKSGGDSINLYERLNDSEAEAVRTGSTDGNLDRVKHAVEHFKQTSGDDDLKLKQYLRDFYCFAFNKGDCPVLAYLIGQGVEITELDFATATNRKSYPLLQTLLDHGWDINRPMSWHEPPALMYAVEDEDLVKWFLSHGASPNATASILDLTALSFAIARASLSSIKLLFYHGGTIGHGELLQFAVFRKCSDCLEVIDFLLELGAPLNDIMYQNHLQSYMMMMAFGLGTPLHKAAEQGRLDVVQHLIKRGADPWIPDARRKLAVDMAEFGGHEEVAKFLRGYMHTRPEVRTYFTDDERFHVHSSSGGEDS